MKTEKKSPRPPAPASARSAAIARWLPTIICLLVVVAITTGVGFTQEPDDLKAVLRELGLIRKEIAELKALVQRQAPGQPAAAPRVAAVGATVALGGAPFRGRADAPITIVEFSDYQCPFCARHASQTLPELDKAYIQSGKVKYVFRNYPLESLHRLAFKAAEAAECANEQGRFWPMHDRLFGNQQALAPEQLAAHAAGVGLDAAAFQQCLASGRLATKIRKDISDAGAIGITGTPAFAIGRTVGASSTLKVEAFLSGAKPLAAFKQEIDRLLAQ